MFSSDEQILKSNMQSVWKKKEKRTEQKYVHQETESSAACAAVYAKFVAHEEENYFHSQKFSESRLTTVVSSNTVVQTTSN